MGERAGEGSEWAIRVEKGGGEEAGGGGEGGGEGGEACRSVSRPRESPAASYLLLEKLCGDVRPLGHAILKLVDDGRIGGGGRDSLGVCLNLDVFGLGEGESELERLDALQSEGVMGLGSDG